MQPRRTVAGGVGAVAWGLFLASSWTWCIGMFLPVPFLRDYGWAGFLLFALPNVAGCVLFGLVTGPPSRSAMLRRFGRGPALFSAVTVAYHLFFAGFVARTLVGPEDNAAAGTALLIAAGLALAAWGLSWTPRTAWPWLGAAAWLASMACWLSFGLGALPEWPWGGAKPATDLFFLAWLVVPGFLCSPFFDLTFHRARRAAPGFAAFGLFAAAFAAVLLFTAAYAGAALAGALAGIVLLHLALQGVFTVAAHLRELRVLAAPEIDGEPGAAAGGGALEGRVAIAARIGWIAAALLGAAAPWEGIYLRFLAFYGVVVPAVFLVGCALGAGADATRWRGRGGIAVAVALAISLPCCELGLFHDMPVLLTVPLPLTVAAALVAVGRRGQPRTG